MIEAGVRVRLVKPWGGVPLGTMATVDEDFHDHDGEYLVVVWDKGVKEPWCNGSHYSRDYFEFVGGPW